MGKSLGLAFTFVLAIFVVFLVSAQLATANAQVAVTTYHYDTLRTGWNSQETALTATTFPSTFGIIATATLDDQVDAQPLFVPGVSIAGSTHDVVYVATESNTVYAIDAASGTILLQTNLGPPVPAPLGCNNNGPNVGITSTPVIDLAANVLYVMAYVNGPSPTYQLHALDLTTLNDTVNHPNGVTVSATHMLANGSTYTFNPAVQRQRPALLEQNGIVYAAFGSFCDFSESRGWILGWDASVPGALTPLLANQLDDTQTSDPGVSPPVFLDSVWMSGYGIAGDGTDLLFTTGNSDCNWSVNPPQCPGQSSFDGLTNIQESVVRLRFPGPGQPGVVAPRVVSIFTPSNVLDLDRNDSDLGSGGVLLFPTGDTTYPYLAAAAGKDGNLLLLNPDSLGTALDSQPSDPCWCGPSFFTGPDGVNRIVTSQGSTIRTYQVQMSPAPHLVLEGSAAVVSGQDPGFFTAVSSNGTAVGSGIIWAVSRPTGAVPDSTRFNLYAFSATANPDGSLTQLFSGVAGAWPNTNGNSNIVPVVANGMVYVASAYLDTSGGTRGQLQIFGPGGTAEARAGLMTLRAGVISSIAAPHVVSGTVLDVSGSTLTLRTRTGRSATVDISQAANNRRIGVKLSAGVPVIVQGSTRTATGALVASSIVRAKGISGTLWPPDHDTENRFRR
jgi:outer membrane protein assembly factor BamB